MIVYGVCAGPSRKYDLYAGPSLERVRRDDDEVVVLRGEVSIFEAYNTILDRAVEHDGLEAVVLLHDDVELLGDELPNTIRELFANEHVAIVGAVGGSGQTSMGWWNAPQVFGRAADSVSLLDFGGGTHTVDSVDGLLMALSPWAARTLRFDDQRFSGFHGYDADICAQARQAGGRVVVAEFDLFHHRSGDAEDFIGDHDHYERTSLLWQLKWKTGSRWHLAKCRLRLAVSDFRRAIKSVATSVRPDS